MDRTHIGAETGQKLKKKMPHGPVSGEKSAPCPFF
jgi:hypothetical protein